MVSRKWLIVVCLALAGLGPAFAQHNVHLFIVGVSEYGDEDSFPRLDPVRETAGEIESYFRATYPLEEGNIHKAIDKEATSEAGLKTLFQSIGNLSESSIVFFFLLGHGEAIADSSRYPSDLLVIGSDTTLDEIKDEPLERISGESIFQEFARLRRGSVLFAFFDTCRSGNLKSVGEKFTTVFQANQISATILCSSGADQKSYSCQFTRGLLRIWGENRRDYLAVRSLANELQTDDQKPDVVVDSPVSIGAIGREQGLVFFSNRSANGVTVLYRANGMDVGKKDYVEKGATCYPSFRERKSYSLQFYRDKFNQFGGMALDLTREPLYLVTLQKSSPYRTVLAEGVTTYPLQSRVLAVERKQ